MLETSTWPRPDKQQNDKACKKQELFHYSVAPSDKFPKMLLCKGIKLKSTLWERNFVSPPTYMYHGLWFQFPLMVLFLIWSAQKQVKAHHINLDQSFLKSTANMRGFMKQCFLHSNSFSSFWNYLHYSGTIIWNDQLSLPTLT